MARQKVERVERVERVENETKMTVHAPKTDLRPKKTKMTPFKLSPAIAERFTDAVVVLGHRPNRLANLMIEATLDQMTAPAPTASHMIGIYRHAKGLPDMVGNSLAVVDLKILTDLWPTFEKEPKEFQDLFRIVVAEFMARSKAIDPLDRLGLISKALVLSEVVARTAND